MSGGSDGPRLAVLPDRVSIHIQENGSSVAAFLVVIAKGLHHALGDVCHSRAL